MELRPEANPHNSRLQQVWLRTTQLTTALLYLSQKKNHTVSLSFLTRIQVKANSIHKSKDFKRFMKRKNNELGYTDNKNILTIRKEALAL